MTTLTIEVTDTRATMQPIRSSSATAIVSESGSAGLADQESPFHLHGSKGSAHEDGSVQEPPGRYITSVEYPALAELWDNDADAIYDEL